MDTPAADRAVTATAADGSFARGIMIGLAIVTPFWIAVAAALAWLL